VIGTDESDAHSLISFAGLRQPLFPLGPAPVCRTKPVLALPLISACCSTRLLLAFYTLFHHSFCSSLGVRCSRRKNVRLSQHCILRCEGLPSTLSNPSRACRPLCAPRSHQRSPSLWALVTIVWPARPSPFTCHPPMPSLMPFVVPAPRYPSPPSPPVPFHQACALRSHPVPFTTPALCVLCPTLRLHHIAHFPYPSPHRCCCPSPTLAPFACSRRSHPSLSLFPVTRPLRLLPAYSHHPSLRLAPFASPTLFASPTRALHHVRASPMPRYLLLIPFTSPTECRHSPGPSRTRTLAQVHPGLLCWVFTRSIAARFSTRRRSPSLCAHRMPPPDPCCTRSCPCTHKKIAHTRTSPVPCHLHPSLRPHSCPSPVPMSFAAPTALATLVSFPYTPFPIATLMSFAYPHFPHLPFTALIPFSALKPFCLHPSPAPCCPHVCK
jgi:hypothetical protein